MQNLRRARLTLGISLVIGLAAPGCALTKLDELRQPSRELVLPGQAFMKDYDNGLRLFVVPDPHTQLVQFDVRQRVGSRDDPEGKTGMAHFLEHLMFQMPADEGSPIKLMSDVQRHTLSFNAYTSADETHYMHTGSAADIERYMKYTALRLGYDCDAVSDDAFERERDVVRNEHRWRNEGVDGEVRDKLTELVFPEGHPYRHRQLDDDLQLASITPEDTCAFAKKYYTASQATVVITGDVDPESILELAERYLLPLPTAAVPDRAQVPPPEFAEQVAIIEAPVKKPTAIILFEMPKRFTTDYIASQAAIQTLFLAIAFFTRHNDSYVERWYPASVGGKEAPVFGVAVEASKTRTLDRAIDEVLDAVVRGFGANLEGKEYESSYDAVRQRTRLQILDRVATLQSRAGAYADYLEQPELGFLGAELAALDDLTPVQAQETGRKVFARSAAMVVKVVPDGSETKHAERASFEYEPNEGEQLSIPNDIDPADAHRPLKLGDISPPEGATLEYRLDNGMRVVLVQSSEFPVMDLQLIVQGAGTVYAPGQHYVAQLATRLYSPAQRRDPQAIMQLYDLAGGVGGRRTAALSTSYTARGLAIYLDFIVAGLSERSVQAEYNGGMERWKEGLRESFRKQSRRQRFVRTNTFYEALYGEGHPHVQALPTDRKDLRDIKLPDVEAFRSKYYRAANSALIVTGGFDMDLTRDYLDVFFGSPELRDGDNPWQEPSVMEQRPQPPEPSPGEIRVITEVDDERVQTDLTIAYPLAEVYGPDHAALIVMASMLNFEVSAVRMELGASYGVYTRLVNSHPSIEIGGAMDSTRAGEATLVIQQAIADLVDGEGEEKEQRFDRLFAFSRREIIGDMINARGDAKLLAGRIAEAIRYGRSYEYFEDLAHEVAALEPAQVRELARRVLQPQRSVTLIQGPREGVEDVVKAAKIVDPLQLPDVIHEDDED